MTGRIIPPGSPEFVALFDSFDDEAFNLETWQDYSEAGEDADFAAFEAGDPPPGGHDAWTDMVRRNRAAGRVMRRVHIVAEPLSPYMRYELCWPYATCTAAGEDIRILSATDPSADGVPRADMWLFDSARLYRQHHDNGRWLGTEPIADQAAVTAAVHLRDRLWAAATPWADYIAARPDLAANLPAPA